MRRGHSPVSEDRLVGALRNEGRDVLAEDIADLFSGVTCDMALGYLEIIAKAKDADQLALSGLGQERIGPSVDALVYIGQSCVACGLVDLGLKVIVATLASPELIQHHIRNPLVGNALTYCGHTDKLVYHMNNAAKKAAQNSPPVKQASILLCTIPKAGSLYLAQNIQQQFGLPDVRVSLDRFPNDRVLIEGARHLARGGRSSWNHLDASKDNVQVLRQAGIERLVLQVRDPRQAMLSFIHHVDRNLVGQNLHYRVRLDPKIPAHWVEWTLAEKIDFYIETWLPKAVKWLERWQQVMTGPHGLDVLLLRFEDMREDPPGHLKQIAEFYGYSAGQFSMSKRDENPHFRSGMKEEWRAVFSAVQQQRANQCLSRHVIDFFGYPSV